jgi:YbbR domain-containing protein
MKWLKGLAENLWMKLFSLCMSLLLFAFVSVENSTPVDVDFRVEYRLADDMMVVNDAPPVVHTTLRGPWAAFRSFDSMDVEPVVLDLLAAGPGTVRHFVDLAAVHPPGGMKVVSVRPAELEVVLDRRVVREVPVHADIAQEPAFGFEMLEVRLVPSRVRVVGPASKMQGLEYVSTRAIDIDGREDDLNLEVDVRPPSPPLRLLDKRVTAFVEISEELSQRTFMDIGVEVIGGPAGAVPSPQQVNLTLKGPRKVLERLSRDAFLASVDVTPEAAAGAATADKSVILRRILPERTQLVGSLPRVRVDLQPSAKRAGKRKAQSHGP